MLSHLVDAVLMGPWEVIEAALARRKPSRDQAWLAAQLEISEQAVSNWKTRGVPSRQYERLADLLNLTIPQIIGREPPPWESAEGSWPFPSIDVARFSRLTSRQQGEIEGKVREMIERFEQLRGIGGVIPFPKRCAPAEIRLTGRSAQIYRFPAV